MPVRTIASLGNTYPTGETGAAGMVRSLFQRSRWESPRRKSVRIWMDGDARTVETGVYTSQLNAAFSAACGYVGTLPLAHMDNYGSGNLAGLFCAYGLLDTGGGGDYSHWEGKACMPLGKPCFAVGPVATHSGGMQWTFQADAYDAHRAACVSGGSYLDTTKSFYLNFYVASRPTTNNGDSLLAYQIRSTNTYATPTASGGTTRYTGRIDISAMQKATFDVCRYRVGPFTCAGDKYVSVKVNAVTSGKYAEPWMCEWENAEKGGVAVSSFSASAVLATLDTSANQCGPMIQAFDPDAIWIRQLVTDPFTAMSTASIKTSLLARIDSYESRYLRRSDVPIIVEVPHIRPQTAGGATEAAYQAVLEEMPGMVADIADSNPRVFLLNTIKMSKMTGITLASQTLDGLTDQGAHAVSTAYVVGDYVETGSGTIYGTGPCWWPCITAHTSAGDGSDAPGTPGGGRKWGPPVHWAFQTESENLLLGTLGGERLANYAVMALMMA